MAYCKECGAYIPDGHSKCLACGFDEAEAAKKAEQAKAYQYKYEEAKKSTTERLKEELEKQRLKELKRKGLLLQDEEILQAMEPGEHPKRLSYTVKSDGTISGDLADRDQLKLLKAYMQQLLGKMVDEIASGNVEANPYTRGTSHDACTFCPYGSICHQSQLDGRRNYKTMTAQRFWEEVKKEVDRRG